MKARRMFLLLSGLTLLAASADGATVSITPATSTLAQGGVREFTVTVSPSTYVREVVVTYQGEPGQDTGTSVPFCALHIFNVPGDNRIVTATVRYNNGDPDDQATATVNVVGLTLYGSGSPLRGWPTTYTVQSNPSGKTLSQINWSYLRADGGTYTSQNNTAWSGKMVINGMLAVSASVSGLTLLASKEITVSPRNWPTGSSCIQDNDLLYGDLPTEWATLGENRDVTSGYGGYVFVPRNGGMSFTPARTLSQVTSGPCTGLWFVASSILCCQRETVINRYIKQNGPILGSDNFYTANANCFSTSVDDFLQAVKNHEYQGTPSTYKSPGGHQGRIDKSLREYGNDARQQIESMTNISQDGLSYDVDMVISICEWEIIDYAVDEIYMHTWGPNWGSENGLGTGQHSTWDDAYEVWTDCVMGPDTF